MIRLGCLSVLWAGLGLSLVLCLIFLGFNPLREKSLTKKRALMGSGAFGLLAYLLYLAWGEPEGLMHTCALSQINRHMKQASQNVEATPLKMLSELKKLEAQVTHSHVALAYLAGIYMELEILERACPLFEQLRQQIPNHTEYTTRWIYCHSLKNKGKLPPSVRDVAEQLTTADPTQNSTINLLAIDSFLQKKYTTAIRYWEFLLIQDRDLTVEKRQVLEKAINSARARLDRKSPIELTVHVSLASWLQSRLNEADAIFVFIQEEEQKLPLAVIKRKVTDLPLVVNLTENDFMLPQQRLIPNKKIKVIAKVSRGGDPLNKKGELRGTSGEIMIKFPQEPIHIVINQEQME